MAETMRAMGATADGVEMMEIPKPTPGRGEVRVKVIASAVNPRGGRLKGQIVPRRCTRRIGFGLISLQFGRITTKNIHKHYGQLFKYPTIKLIMDGLVTNHDKTEFHWTFIGINSGLKGTGNRVRFSGVKKWEMNEEGLIQISKGSFDTDEYNRQLKHGMITETSHNVGDVQCGFKG